MESELNDNVLDTNKTMITCNTSLSSLADKAEKANVFLFHFRST